MFENENTPVEQNEVSLENEAQEQPSAAEQSLFDLDSADKFRFQGKEWTRQEWEDHYKKSTMLQSDYTQKTQALAQERKEMRFWKNLYDDLDTVRKNPERLNDFLRIYPKDFHRFVSNIKPSGADQSQAQVPPQLNQFETRVERLERQIYEREVQAIERELDSRFQSLQQKYPDVDEELVLAKAEKLLDRKVQNEEKPEISDREWDALWKSEQDKFDRKFKEKSSAQFKSQKSASDKAKDVGPGGGVPARSGAKPRTIREASEMALKELE